MLNVSNNKVNFPRIRHIALTGFSLYSLQPDIQIDVTDGVFCLAGANGLGKSTFLSAVNFGLTGIVACHWDRGKPIHGIRS